MGMLDYTITRTDNPTSAEELNDILANPGFGKHFTYLSLIHISEPTRQVR